MSRTVTYKDKFQSRFNVTGSGLLGSEESTNLVDEVHLRVVTENAPAGSEITVKAKLNNQQAFTVLGTVGANTTEIFDTATWDQVRFECSTYTGDFLCTVSGFHIHPFIDSVSIAVDPNPGDAGTDNGRAIYGEILALAKDATSVVTSYTVPAGQNFFLDNVEFSGGNAGTWVIKVATVVKGKKRTSSSVISDDFHFKNFKATAGDVIEVSVTNERNPTADFEATINGTLI
jgi:hypothetical protein